MTRLELLLQWYATLSPQSLRDIGAYYRPDARFRDPFNDVQGVDAIRAIFEHMFRTTGAPRFVVRDVVGSDALAFVTWDFTFELRGTQYAIHGATRFALDAQGRVMDHRDYWDAAGELWARLPVLGVAVRWLRRRFGAR